VPSTRGGPGPQAWPEVSGEDQAHQTWKAVPLVADLQQLRIMLEVNVRTVRSDRASVVPSMKQIVWAGW
jgi:hypothetical protein